MLAQPYDWLLRFTLSAFMLLTIGMLLVPVWQLAKTRPTLIIVFSRAVANFIRLCFDFPTLVIFYILDVSKLMPDAFFYITNCVIRTTECALHMHNLALAANRAHAICFPFHYDAFYSKKRKFYMICLLVWLLAMGVGIPDQFFRISPVFRFSPFTTANKACMAIAGFCYVVLFCGMKKFNSTSANTPSSEKDPIRILVVCMVCLLISALPTVVLNQLATYALQWPDVPRTIHYWASNCIRLLAHCTEEILLVLLVPEFRVNIRRQFRKIFCCFCGEESTVGFQKEVKINHLTNGLN